MGDMISASGGRCIERIPGEQLTSDTTKDSYGSWSEVVASTAENSYSMAVHLYIESGAANTIDIGIGELGSEIVLVEKLMICAYSNGYVHQGYTIPIQVPAGTRISARMANVVNSSANTCYCSLRTYAPSFNSTPPFQVCDWLARATITSPGAGIYSGWTELQSSLPASYRAILLVGDHGNLGAVSSHGWYADWAIGGSGSEVVVIEGVHWIMDSSTDQMTDSVYPIFDVSLPEGERLSWRNMCTNTDYQGYFSIWGFR